MIPVLRRMMITKLLIFVIYIIQGTEMNITIQRRAEIALRSLSQNEKGQLERALNKLTSLSPAEFYIRPEIQKLISASGEKLYSLIGSRRLRIILSVDADSCIVEDILDHDRLEQLLPH